MKFEKFPKKKFSKLALEAIFIFLVFSAHCGATSASRAGISPDNSGPANEQNDLSLDSGSSTPAILDLEKYYPENSSQRNNTDLQSLLGGDITPTECWPTRSSSAPVGNFKFISTTQYK